MKHKNRIINYILWILVIIWMIIIFILSNSPAKDSGNNSKNIIRNTIEISTKVTDNIGITKFKLTKKDLNKIAQKLNEPLRECMHGFEYFILSILLLVALHYNNIDKRILITIIVCVIYALSDEIHQIFIDGRSFEFLDIFIDTTGSIIGCLIFACITNKKGIRS